MKLMMLFLFGLAFVSLVAAQNIDSAIIPSGKTATMEMYMLKGDQAIATVSVTGGNERIYLSIKDRSGNIVGNRMIVIRSGNFTIQAADDGPYYVIFDNSVTADADKNVTLSYITARANEPTFEPDTSCYSWFFILALLGMVMAVRRG